MGHPPVHVDGPYFLSAFNVITESPREDHVTPLLIAICYLLNLILQLIEQIQRLNRSEMVDVRCFQPVNDLL